MDISDGVYSGLFRVGSLGDIERRADGPDFYRPVFLVEREKIVLVAFRAAFNRW